MDNVTKLLAEELLSNHALEALIWVPFRFDRTATRDDGYYALVQLVRPDGTTEYHKYTIVYQRRMDPEHPELRFSHSIQYYVLFDRQYNNIDDILCLTTSDVGRLIRVYGSLESAKVGAELDIRRLCGDAITCQAILPY